MLCNIIKTLNMIFRHQRVDSKIVIAYQQSQGIKTTNDNEHQNIAVFYKSLSGCLFYRNKLIQIRNVKAKRVKKTTETSHVYL